MAEIGEEYFLNLEKVFFILENQEMHYIFSTNSKVIYCSIIPSIYEAVSKVNIFGKGYSPGPIISCPVSDLYSICPSKANFEQEHGYFFTVTSFFLKIFAIFTLRVKTSHNEK